MARRPRAPSLPPANCAARPGQNSGSQIPELPDVLVSDLEDVELVPDGALNVPRQLLPQRRLVGFDHPILGSFTLGEDDELAVRAESGSDLHESALQGPHHGSSVFGS